MKKLNVLLVCGSGASSGFMATNMRRAAVARGVDMDIKARSESEIENYVKVILMKPEYYSTLDGNKALDHLIAEME